MNTMSAETAAPEPPLEPPGMRSVSQGLRTAPKCGLLDVTPYASSCMPVLPMSTAPAAASFSTTVASRSGTWCMKMTEPAVVRTPRVSNTSLTAMGMPWSGPRSVPRASSVSAAWAWARALWSSTVIMAFSLGFVSPVRRSAASVSSADETVRWRSACAASRMVTRDPPGKRGT